MQTVNGLLGLVGSLVAAAGIVFALAALQPLLLPLVLLGYVPLWFVSTLNSRDLYRFMHGMTPNERQRHYLERVLMGRDPAKEVRSFRLGGLPARAVRPALRRADLRVALAGPPADGAFAARLPGLRVR